MATFSEIKKEMGFYEDFSSLIDVLKSLAISQYYALEKKVKGFDLFGNTIKTFFKMVDLKTIHHPFLNPEKKALGVVAITSDRGLLGGLNNRIVTTAADHLKDSPGELIIIGSQGQQYIPEMKIPFKGFPGIEEEKKESLASQLRDYVVGEVLAGRFGSIRVVYPHALSIMVQRVEQLTLLPCSAWSSKDNSQTTLKKGSEILRESSVEDIFEYLAFLWMGQKFYEIFGLSRLAEYGARYLHLEETIEKIKKENRKLRLRYFHARHEVIDQQMRELFAAKSIYAQ